MDERLTFLYGERFDAHSHDLGDLEVRSRLLEGTFDGNPSPAQLLGREVLANQIYDDDPPEIWQSVKRLLETGASRNTIFGQLALAFGHTMRAGLDSDQRFDKAAYAGSLARLPLPTGGAVAAELITVVRSDQGVGVDDLVARTMSRLGRDSADDLAEDLVDRVMDHLDEDFGPLAMLAGDRMVHVADLTTGIVLTHRLSEIEQALGTLTAAFDLTGFNRWSDLRLPEGESIEVFSVERGHLAWAGPDGWLDAFATGSVLAVRIGEDGLVSVEQLDGEPPVDSVLVGRLRGAYDRAVEDPWLPVSIEELVLDLLLEDHCTFADPTACLSTLCATAGLERRLDQVAHDASVWHNELRTHRIARLLEMLNEDTALAEKAMRALDVADLVAGVDMSAVPEIEGPPNTALLRSVLEDLCDLEVLSAVAIELLDEGDAECGDADTDARSSPPEFAAALVGAASRSAHKAVARFLAALCAERIHEPAVAEQHLVLANDADPKFGPATDRLAWYASVRGDAARAVRLWRSVAGSAVFDQDLHTVQPFAIPVHARLGRNETCWCGSGRKYKQCHLGQPELPPLPERIGWLCRKAVGYIERYGSPAQRDVLEIARARVTDADDTGAVAETFDDPVVMDLALTEGGWFGRFLEEYGDMLPGDEAVLAHSWELVERTLYEIVEIRAGRGVTVRDLRSGDLLDVRERTFSRDARAGAVVCGRAVHDGETHQFIGGLFPVHPGREADLLDLLDEKDPIAIAQWVAALHRPPILQTREREPLVQCDLVVRVPESATARAFLDATYNVAPDAGHGSGTDRWVEMFALNDDEEILRTSLELDGDCLSVHTMSATRSDRVREAIADALPGAFVESDTRVPMNVASIIREQERLAADGPIPGGPDDRDYVPSPEQAEAIEAIRARFEERWCDESVPALAGFTPRQAAADLTRRETLIRLIDSFDEHSGPANAITMRPGRLRELLDLKDTAGRT